MVDMVAEMEMDMVADMEVDMVVDIGVNKVADKVADMVADMELDMVADMEVEIVADMVADIVSDMPADKKKVDVCTKTKCIGPKLFDAKCTRLACLQSFENLFCTYDLNTHKVLLFTVIYVGWAKLQ